MDSRTSPVSKPTRSASPSPLVPLPHIEQHDAMIHRRSPSPSPSISSRASTKSSARFIMDQANHETSSVAGSTVSTRLTSPSSPHRLIHSPDGSHRRNTSSNASVVSGSSSVAQSESGHMTSRRIIRSNSNASVHSFSSSVTPTTRSNQYYLHSSSSASSSSDVPRRRNRIEDTRQTHVKSSLRMQMNESIIDEYDSYHSQSSKNSRRRDYTVSTQHSVKSANSGYLSESSMVEETARIQAMIDGALLLYIFTACPSKP